MTILYRVMKAVNTQARARNFDHLTPLEKKVLMNSKSSSSLDHLSLLVGSALLHVAANVESDEFQVVNDPIYIDSSQTSALIFLSQLAGIPLNIRLSNFRPSGMSLHSNIVQSLDDLVRLELLEKKILPHPQYPEHFPRIARTYYQATEMLKEVYPHLVKELSPAQQVLAVVPPLFIHVGEYLGTLALAVYLTHLRELMMPIQDENGIWQVKFKKELDVDLLKQHGLEIAIPRLIQYYELYLELVKRLKH